MNNRLIQVVTKAGDPIQAGNTHIIPFSKIFRINIPGLPGGLIWNRPSSIVVMNEGGGEQVIPIQDVTRQGLWTMMAAGFFTCLLIGLLLGRRRRS